MRARLRDLILAMAAFGPVDAFPAEPIRALVLARGNNVLEGTISLEALRVRTAYGTLTVPCEDLLRVEFARDPEKDDKVSTRKFSIVGRAELEELEISLPQGRLRVPRCDLERLVLHGSQRIEAVDRILMVKTWSDPNEEFARTREIIARMTKLKIAEFTGTSAAELKRALSKHRVLVLPEFERVESSLNEVATGTANALREFVRSGGTVVSCGGSGNMQFLTASGLLRCQGGAAGQGHAVVAKRHAILRGISGPVTHANATFPIRPLSPGRVQALLKLPSGEIVVGIATLGEGAIIYCGWDYFQSAEPHQKILANAVLWAAGRRE